MKAEKRADMLLRNARWALNNVATFGTPSCLPTLNLLRNDPGLMARDAQRTRVGDMPADLAAKQMGNDLNVRTPSPSWQHSLAS